MTTILFLTLITAYYTIAKINTVLNLNRFVCTKRQKDLRVTIDKNIDDKYI